MKKSLQLQHSNLLHKRKNRMRPQILLQSRSWFQSISWRTLSLWSTVQFRGESLWKPTIPEMAWLFPAYAIDGTEPPIAHRHHISTQNQRHRSIVPRQHIQHVTVISKQEVQRQNQVLLQPSTKTLPFGLPSIEKNKKTSPTDLPSESLSPRSSSLFTSNMKHHFAKAITSKQSVLATQISYLTQMVVENQAEIPSQKNDI